MTQNREDEYEGVDSALSEAVSLLRKLGMTEYAARTFLGLQRTGGGTAREIAEVSSVPRTKVYDVVSELKELGLVEIRQSSPREFYPASKETTRRKFQREYEQAVTSLFDILSDLPPVEGNKEVDGVWVVTGTDAIDERMVHFVDEASDRVVFIAVDGTIPDAAVDPLAGALDRDVDVVLGGIEEPPNGTLREATVVQSAGLWADSEVAIVVLTDRSSVLVVSRTDSGSDRQSGIWGRGEHNMLVSVFDPVVRSWLPDSSVE